MFVGCEWWCAYHCGRGLQLRVLNHARAVAWICHEITILAFGSAAKFALDHFYLGQLKFWDDLKERMIIGTPCLEPRVENVPVRMPFPPAKDVSSIFKTQQLGGMKSVYED